MTNTHLPVILLQVFSATGAFAVFLLRQHFITLPRELEDAGRVDGLETLGVFWYIMLPLSRPALATAAIFAVLNSWNDYFNPLIYLSKENLLTLPLALQRFTDPLGGVYWNLTLAAGLLGGIAGACWHFYWPNGNLLKVWPPAVPKDNDATSNELTF